MEATYGNIMETPQEPQRDIKETSWTSQKGAIRTPSKISSNYHEKPHRHIRESQKNPIEIPQEEYRNPREIQWNPYWETQRNLTGIPKKCHRDSIEPISFNAVAAGSSAAVAAVAAAEQ